MARKKVTLQWIANDATRRATFKKRRKGLMKKASELATLCDVDACVVVYGEGETQQPAEVWPDVATAARVLARFRAMPELEQCKKMMDMEAFLTQRIGKLREQLHKARRENREREITLLLHDAIVGRRPAAAAGLSVEDIAGLGWMVENKLGAVREALERRQQQQQHQAGAAGGAGKQLQGNVGVGVPAPTTTTLQLQIPPPPLVPAGYSIGQTDAVHHHHQATAAINPQPQAGSWLMEVVKAGGDLGALVYSGFFGGGAGASSSSGGAADMLPLPLPPPHLGNLGAGFGWPDPDPAGGIPPFPPM